jgi:beta-N-acetylhexosaminidase
VDIKNKKKILFLVIIILLLCVSIIFFLRSIYTNKHHVKAESIPYLSTESAWVDSMLINMSIEQKIGSLFIYDAGELDSTKEQLLDLLIKEYYIGGTIFNNDSISNFIEKINEYDSSVKIPVFSINNSITGYPEVLNSICRFPDINTINAVTDDSLIFDFMRHNVKVNHLLSYDLQIIDPYLFSGDSARMSNYIRLIQDSTDLACLKLNITNNAIIDSNKFNKWNNIIKRFEHDGLSSIFLSQDFKLDTGKFATNYSKYLKSEERFNGLIITEYKDKDDLLNNFISSGVDMIYTKRNFIDLINGVKELYVNNQLSIEALDEKVRKILLAKSWTGMEDVNAIAFDSVIPQFSSTVSKKISLLLTNKSVTICNNRGNLLPIKSIKGKTYVCNIGKRLNDFNEMIKYYTEYHSKAVLPDTNNIKSIKFYTEYNRVILTLKNIGNWKQKGKYINDLVIKNKDNIDIVVVNFDSPDNLKYLSDCPVIIQMYNYNPLEQKLAVQAIFGGISCSGRLPYHIDGFSYVPLKTKKTRLGFTIPEEFGLQSEVIESIDTIIREGLNARAFPGCQVFIAKEGKVIFHKSYGYHTYARKIKVKWDDLYDIASITKIAATTLATMKMIDEGKMKLNDKLEEYFKNTVIEYTKIKPDTFIKIDTVNIKELSKKELKKFVKDKDTIHLDDTIFVAYDTLFQRVTPKRNIFKCKIKDLLMHKSGLPPSMPILRYILYKEDSVISLPDTFIVDTDSLIVFDTLTNRKDSIMYLWHKYFNTKELKDTSMVQIAKNMYLRKEYQDTLWIDTKQIRVYSKSVYMYSDVNPILVQQAIDTINEYPINEYLEKRFYKPLGLRTICYLPLKEHKRNRITPTEEDKYWRGQLLRGYVHDPSAALMGGIAGNAGLFSNAYDLGVLFQMLLDGGIYGSRRYISNKTVNKFTAYQPDSHRGLGFDKANKKNINAPDAPSTSYGHTGFTGTCVWVDPENELVYVFLSNRVNPSVKNWKSNTLKIRQRVHQVVYDAISSMGQ